jgi:hypothetical protein
MTEQTTRTATCSCGQLRVACDGEPVRVSMCHCLECQKRTGAPFGAQARFDRTQVTTEGAAREFERIGDEGNRITFRFCPTCGSTVYWTLSGLPDNHRRRGRQFRRSRLAGAARLGLREPPPRLGHRAGSSGDAALRLIARRCLEFSAFATHALARRPPMHAQRARQTARIHHS